MKLKIIALSYLFPNRKQPNYGVFVYNRLLAVQKLCEVRVVAPVQWYPFKGLTGKAEKVLKEVGNGNISGLKVFRPSFPVIPRYMKWFDAFSYWSAVQPVVNNLVNEGYDFDLVDVHWSYPDILAAYTIAKRSDRPFIVTIRGREALYLGERSARKWMLDSLLKKADAIVALSSELKTLLIDIGVANRKINVILNGVDPSNFRNVGRLEARRHLKISPNEVVLLSVGSLIERKGHHELINIMPELCKNRDLSLYIVGSSGPEGDFGSKLRKMAAELAPLKIFFIDGVEHKELCHWYSAADLFCLATKGEGCPNVVLEAMSCGTPVVVTDVGAVSDIVEEGKNGFTVTCVDQLQEKIGAALALQWDRQSISDRMRGITWDACAEQVLSVYHRVIDERAAKASGFNGRHS